MSFSLSYENENPGSHGRPNQLITVDEEISFRRPAGSDHSSHSSAPHHDLEYDPPQRRAIRKEMEARRYSGKDSVEEYLSQFELTARRNGWDREEMATSLLCALDGPARSILSQLEDPAAASYAEVKTLLKRRFGSSGIKEIHEEALARLKLQGNDIRELAQEAVVLSRKAYPELSAAQRERFSVRAVLNAIGDRDITFYIKDKEPQTLDDVCTAYERYDAIRGSRQRLNVRNIESEPSSDSQLVDCINKLAAKLDALTAAPEPNPVSQPVANRGEIPRKPCPVCHQHGHWARHCPNKQDSACLECGGAGHRWRHCPRLGNGKELSSASDGRSRRMH